MFYVVTCLVLLLGAAALAWRTMLWMPGRRWRGPIPPLNDTEIRLRNAMHKELIGLAADIGERNLSRRSAQLAEAARFIEASLEASGHRPHRQEFSVDDNTVWNIDVECTGRHHPHEIIIVGAHYDTVPYSPGANDNASAVVANLALARDFAQRAFDRTVRLAFFANEESPYYMTDAMGSLNYARRCRANGEKIVGMVCLETIGCYLDAPTTQRYPVAALRYLYPTTGNFVAVVGNVRSRRLVRRVVGSLRRTSFPSEGIAAPRWMKDIFRSDHAAFWYCGYPALMITDTANFRYRYYHTPEDTVDKINLSALARVVAGVTDTVRDLAGDIP